MQSQWWWSCIYKRMWRVSELPCEWISFDICVLMEGFTFQHVLYVSTWRWILIRSLKKRSWNNDLLIWPNYINPNMLIYEQSFFLWWLNCNVCVPTCSVSEKFGQTISYRKTIRFLVAFLKDTFGWKFIHSTNPSF